MCYALYLLHKYANNYVSRYNLLGLTDKQSIALFCGRAQTYDHLISRQQRALNV